MIDSRCHVPFSRFYEHSETQNLAIEYHHPLLFVFIYCYHIDTSVVKVSLQILYFFVRVWTNLVQRTRMAGCAKQRGLSLMKGHSIPTSVKKLKSMTKFMTSSSQIGASHFHGWATTIMKGKCSTSHDSESFLCMQISPVHSLLDLQIFGLNCSKHIYTPPPVLQ